MSPSAQAKVLRALQESRITRVGGDRPIEVDVRVVAATNKDLLEEVGEGRFREDLYHRLSVILIHVPPLRERKTDIPLIADFILGHAARRNGVHAKAFTDGALDRLQRYEWRGNVRELSNVVERLLILSEGDEVTESDVQLYVRPGGAGQDPIAGLLNQFDQFTDFRDMAEKLFIERKLEEFGWNVSQTAESIGIQRSHLYNKLNKYGIERDEE
jgi:DNA-binding NtrC family response regulator